MTSCSELGTADVVVIGAGIVGLAHAYEATERGLSVAVVERDERASGASVRNFGHGCITAQDGQALDYALAARDTWLRLAKEAGFHIGEAGTVVVARAADELELLTELAEYRDGQVDLLDERAVLDRVPVAGAIGGAHFPLDIRVDPREAVHAVAASLADRGVTFHWSTTAHTIGTGEVGTSRGVLRASHVVVAVGHDVDRHFPGLAAQRAVQRCSLHMLRVAEPHGRDVDCAVLTGFSMLRYAAFAACRSHDAVRSRLERDHPRLVDAGLNLMFTQLPGGDLTIGDTHAYQATVPPYRAEHLDELVLAETARLLGVRSLAVRERWTGVYASAPDPFLVETPCDDVRVVAVTSGIGMTTAFGLAPAVLDDLLA
ncbi:MULTISPECIES: TIGR03364 family FAD-dependent oxidoreductase [Prauserella salsuginis group]|uniref:TIGR03364 family FAD-dependent oxidoreductase n=1 Tax=Prauserella salsuginis TaxID=387889 RepID=A0ABW6G0D7_9PSEU|nr:MULTISPECIES: TIGR03364 family FAD-dependent oxidoreductase [Prauserella salsuginis group]MCR3721273.1 FAD dependent oxidoreductase TIGR03364 [Prauserella flava]MCR3734647.1 FAD dependent oxidoreductase TIGR03364 [Prauserella salsuginis]